MIVITFTNTYIHIYKYIPKHTYINTYRYIYINSDISMCHVHINMLNYINLIKLKSRSLCMYLQVCFFYFIFAKTYLEIIIIKKRY